MHQLWSANHCASIHLGKSLMAQANPQGGCGGRQFAEHIEADPGLIRIAGAR